MVVLLLWKKGSYMPAQGIAAFFHVVHPCAEDASLQLANSERNGSENSSFRLRRETYAHCFASLRKPKWQQDPVSPYVAAGLGLEGIVLGRVRAEDLRHRAAPVATAEQAHPLLPLRPGGAERERSCVEDVEDVSYGVEGVFVVV